MPSLGVDVCLTLVLVFVYLLKDARLGIAWQAARLLVNLGDLERSDVVRMLGAPLDDH